LGQKCTVCIFIPVHSHKSGLVCIFIPVHSYKSGPVCIFMPVRIFPNRCTFKKVYRCTRTNRYIFFLQFGVLITNWPGKLTISASLSTPVHFFDQMSKNEFVFTLLIYIWGHISHFNFKCWDKVIIVWVEFFFFLYQHIRGPKNNVEKRRIWAENQ
jgi:hypothetical protein